ncbi:MAG: hypothetical protein AAB557_02810 [Patescibacteria group bacterium]
MIIKDIHIKISQLPEPSDLFINFSSAFMFPEYSFHWQHPSNNFHRFFDSTDDNTARANPAFQRFQLLYPDESRELTTLLQRTLWDNDNDSYAVLELKELRHAYAIMRLLVSTSDPYSDDPYFLRG